MLKLEDFKAIKQRVDEVILETHLIHSDAFSAEYGMMFISNQKIYKLVLSRLEVL
ncbi:MAG: hypothetical protein ACLRWM_11045 [Streptococcus sp.]